MLAISSMTLDHAGRLLAPGLSWPCYLGRIAFPLFVHLVGVGSARSRSVPAYVVRLLILGLISQPVYAWAITPDRLNVLFTLSAGLGLWWLLSIVDLVGASVLLILSALIPMDYGVLGVLFVASSCWSCRVGRPWHLFVWLLVGWPDLVSMFLGFLALSLAWAAPCLPSFRCRWAYWFYPAHLAILLFIQRGLL